MPEPANTQNKIETKIVSPSGDSGAPPFTPGEVQLAASKLPEVKETVVKVEPTKAPVDTSTEKKPDTKEQQASGDLPKGIDYNDFLKEKEERTSPDIIKTPEELIKEKSEEAKGILPTKKEKVKYPDNRDYSDIPEQDQPLFKQMSNESFAKLKPLFIEHGKLKKENEELKTRLTSDKSTLPDSWYEHERAYVLSPEFQQAQANSQISQYIYNHWMTQLENVRSGKDWENLTFNEESGKYVLSEPLAANAASEARIIANLGYAQNLVSQYGGRVKEIAEQFNSRVKNDLDFIESKRKEYFGVYDDEKHPMRPVIQKTIEMLPPSFRKGPLANLLGCAVANNVQLRLICDELSRQLNIKNGIQNDAEKAGPNMNTINRVAGKSSLPTVDFSDFKKEMQ